MTDSARPDPRSSLAPGRRRWLRLSLRGLMVLVLVAGGGLGWMLHTIRTQREAIAAVEAVRGRVVFDYDFDEVARDARGIPRYRQEPAAPGWLRRWLGDELFQSVRVVWSQGEPTSAAWLNQISAFAEAEELVLGDLAPDPAALRPLARFGRLRSLEVGGPNVGDPALAAIGRVAQLRQLAIDVGPAASDAGLAHLEGLTQLEELSLANDSDQVSLTDSGVARLVAALPRLKQVRLLLPALGATLAALGRDHPDLVNLNLSGSPVTDADLAGVAGMTNLTHLDLNQTTITDAGLAHLRPLGKLTLLDLNGVRGVTDAGLRHLAALTSLQELRLNDAAVTDAGLPALARLNRLQGLYLRGATVTDAGLVALARLPNLSGLELDSPQITDAGLLAFQGLRKLEYLNLSGTRITAAGRAGFLQSWGAHPPNIYIFNIQPSSPTP